MTFTFAGVVADLAQRTPEATAVVFGDTRLSFGRLEERATGLARVLADLGVRRQQRVGFLGRNAPAFFELLTACSLQDAVLVGLNWRLSPAELARIVEDAELSVLVCAPDLVPLVAEVAARSGLRLVTTDAELDGLITAAGTTPLESGAGTSGESVLLQLYSSGTTGLPKGTLITNDNLSFTQTSGRLLYGMDADTVNLVPSPLFHIGGVGYGTTALSQGG